MATNDTKGIEFLILGPLEVRRQGRSIDLGGQRAQLALSALLLEAGQIVTTDSLAEMLWAEDPPASARTQLHILISQLRKALGERHAIETVPGGYRVNPDEAVIDAHVVERLIADGRQRRDPSAYRTALTMWRGPVLDGRHGHEAERLAELRLSASEEWAELELEHGDAALVVEALTPLVADHPHREGVRAQLMIALDRVGARQAALRLYHEGRQRLEDELGIEPGAELQKAARTVLGSTAASVPAQLPGDITRFTGREADVEELCDLVTRGPVAISGPAGIGKSALAIHVAHRVAERFPDGQLYVNLHGFTPEAQPVEAADVLGRFLRALGVAAASIPADEGEAAAEFRTLTHGRRLLIVLDNAAGAEQLAPLLPGSATCGVLITSRRTPQLALTHRWLDVLEPREARALLARFAGAARLEREPEAVEDVVRLCGGLPLAMTILGARLVTSPGLPVRALADRLADEHRRLAELAVDDQAVRSSFSASYTDLGAAEARLFRLFGLLDVVTMSVPVAAALAGLGESDTAALLDRLVDIQLMEACGPGRYRMHDLLRLFARERAMSEESAGERARAVHRALHCYVATARRAALTVEPRIMWRIDWVPEDLAHPGEHLENTEHVLEWVEAESENLVAAARQAVAGDDPAIGAYLGACLDTPLEHRAAWREQLALAEITLEAARYTGDPRHHGLGQNDLGWAKFALGREHEALAAFDLALEWWLPIHYDTGVALALHGRGTTLRALERYEESLAALRQAMALWRVTGHERHVSSCLTGIGLTHQRRGDHAQAIAAHERSVELARTTGARVTEIMALGNLGEAYRLDGQKARAATTFREALRLGGHRGLEGTYWEAEHLWGLGRTLSDRSCYRRSAAILLRLGLITEAQAGEIELSGSPVTPDVIRQQL